MSKITPIRPSVRPPRRRPLPSTTRLARGRRQPIGARSVEGGGGKGLDLPPLLFGKLFAGLWQGGRRRRCQPDDCHYHRKQKRTGKSNDRDPSLAFALCFPPRVAKTGYKSESPPRKYTLRCWRLCRSRAMWTPRRWRRCSHASATLQRASDRPVIWSRACARRRLTSFGAGLARRG